MVAISTREVPRAEESNSLAWAKAYHSMGFSVIPLRAYHRPGECRKDGNEGESHVCKEGGRPFSWARGSKLPSVAWKPYQQERATLSQIEDWWGENPSYGVGIVCGPVSAPEGKSLVCLDFDDPAVFNKITGGLDGALAQGTAIQKTRRGYHCFVLADGDVSSGRDDDLHLDVQASGKIAVVHPTIHPITNESYEWVTLPDDNEHLWPVGDLHKWFDKYGIKVARHATETGNIIEMGDYWVTTYLGEDISEGEGRHNRLTNLAGYLVKQMPADIAISTLRLWNAQHCQPPLPDAEVFRVVRDFASKEDSKALTQRTDTEIEHLGAFMRRRRNALLDRFFNPERVSGLQTSFKLLNEHIGGFEAGLLYLLAARPGGYKTTFGMEWAKDVARSGHLVAAFSLEQSKEAIVSRWLQQGAGITTHSLRARAKGIAPDSPEGQRLIQAMDEMAHLPLHLDSTPDLSIAKVEQRLRSVEDGIGKPVELLVIDYLNLLAPEGEEAGNAYHQITTFVVKLGGLAKRLGIPVLVLAQLNREAERDPEPQAYHLRDSGAIEQRSDVIMMTKKLDQGDQGFVEGRDRVRLWVRKMKDGPSGVYIDYEMQGPGRQIAEMEPR